VTVGAFWLYEEAFTPLGLVTLPMAEGFLVPAPPPPPDELKDPGRIQSIFPYNIILQWAWPNNTAWSLHRAHPVLIIGFFSFLVPE